MGREIKELCTIRDIDKFVAVIPGHIMLSNLQKVDTLIKCEVELLQVSIGPLHKQVCVIEGLVKHGGVCHVDPYVLLGE